MTVRRHTGISGTGLMGNKNLGAEGMLPHLTISISGLEAAGKVTHICGKHYGGISREWRELETKSEEKFKSWVTLKVVKKISAWVFHN